MDYYRTTHQIRADQVAHEVFGDITYTAQIIRMNQEQCRLPIIPAGVLLKMPKTKKREPKGINLWS